MSNDLSADLASLKIDRDRPPSSGGAMRLVVLTGVLLVIAAAVYLAVPYLRSRVFAQEVEVTEVSLISPAQAQVELTSTGYVKPQTTSLVTSKVTGKISKVHVAQGARPRGRARRPPAPTWPRSSSRPRARAPWPSRASGPARRPTISRPGPRPRPSRSARSTPRSARPRPWSAR
jgi:hypothetical protein